MLASSARLATLPTEDKPAGCPADSPLKEARPHSSKSSDTSAAGIDDLSSITNSDDGFGFDDARASSLEITVINRRVSASVGQAVSAFNPTPGLFEDLRQLGPQVKKHLPSKDRLPSELKELVQAVQNECNTFQAFVTIFVRTVLAGTMELQKLSTEVYQLSQRGCLEISRVELGQVAWDSAVLKHHIESVKKQFEDLQKFVGGKATETRDRLDEFDGKAMQSLMDEINGSGSTDVRADIIKSLAENATLLLKHKQEVTKQDVALRFMHAMKDRCELQLSRSGTSITETQASIEAVKRDIAACDASKSRSLQETQAQLKARHESLHADMEADLNKLQNDPQKAKLQQQADEVMQEAAKITMELDLASLAPEPPLHFLFALDKSGSMAGPRWANLMSSLRTMAMRRKQVAQRTKDRVSVVLYHNSAWVVVFNKSWDDVLSCPEFADNCFWGPTYFAPAFAKAKEIASQVRPVHGTRLKTQIVFVTDGEPYDMEAGVRAAQRLYAECSQSGPTSGFVILVGEEARELEMNRLVKALNNGEDNFVDDQGNNREFCAHAVRPQDIQDKFDLLTQNCHPDILATQMRFKFANDKQEKVEQLIARKDAELKNRQTNIIKRMKEDAGRMQESGDDKLQHIHQHFEEHKKALEEILSGLEAQETQQQQLLEQQNLELEELMNKVQHASDLKDSLIKLHDKVESTFSDEQYMQDAQKQLDECRKKYSSMENPNELITVLTNAQEKMVDSQVLFDQMLRSFEMACGPVQNMIRQLEDSCKADFSTKTAKNKLLECYKECCGLSELTPHKSEDDNFRAIVAFHCPWATQKFPEGVEVFLSTFRIENFVDLCLLEEKKRPRAKAELEKKFNEELLAQCKSKAVIELRTQIRMLTARLGRAQARVKKLENELAVLEERIAEAEASGADERVLSRLYARKEELETKIEEAQEEVEKIEEELDEAWTNVMGLIELEYGPVVGLVDKIYQGVLDIFGQVMLRKGLDVTKFNLRSLEALFSGPILAFSRETAKVSKNFLQGGQGRTSLDLTLARSQQDRLLAQFRHLVPASGALKLGDQ